MFLSHEREGERDCVVTVGAAAARSSTDGFFELFGSVLAVSGCVALCDLGPRTSDWEPTFSPSFNYAIIPCGTAQNKYTVYSCTGACKEA